MIGLRHWVAVVVILVMGALLAGCSGMGDEMNGSPHPTSIPRVDEYVGDGGGSAKPWPAGLSMSQMNTQAVGQLLGWGAWPITTKVPYKQTSWFRLPALTAGKTIIVTLQPNLDEDADLYLMNGSPTMYPGSGACLGYSVRYPSGGSDTVQGLAPDWVAVEMPGSTNGFPVAQVAVAGAWAGPSKEQFWIEADKVSALIVNGGGYTHTVIGGQSNWYSFPATSGKKYTVRLQSVTAGDPDSYVYGKTSIDFKAKHTAAGGGDAVFTATATETHYIRVFGENSGDNTYHVLVRQP